MTLIKNKNTGSPRLIPIQYFLAAFSGLLLFLSFPKYGSGVLAWIALVPLFYALKDAAKISQALFLGFTTGVVAYIGIIYWIAYVIVNYGYLPLYQGIIFMLLLACYLSIYLSLFAGGIIFFRDRIPLWLTAPVLWVCFEYGKSVILTGFPWENLGYSQYANIALIQAADVVGVFGISFLIVLVNAALFELASKRTKQQYILAAIVCMIVVLALIYGAYRKNEVTKIVDNTPGIKVSLIQGNIDQSVKWNENFRNKTLSIYEDLSLKQSPGAGNLIVWPETALPFKFQDANIYHDRILNLTRASGSWFIFGAVSSSHRNGAEEYFNSAYLLNPAGEVKGRYDKVHLVPYGEYVPYRDYMPFINGFTAGIGDFGVGEGFYPLTMDGRKIGVLICYEGILPDAARTYKNHGAELLVNITNDAWFGATSAPYQHFSMAIFRTVENRIYLVRAANTGVSGIVDPTGKIVAKTDIFKEDALQGHVKFVKISTLYEKWGDVIVVISFILMIFFIIISFVRRNKNGFGKHPGNHQ